MSPVASAPMEPEQGAAPQFGIGPTANALPRDLSSALLALVMQSRTSLNEAARSEVEHAQDLMEWAKHQIEAAMERAREAEKHAGFFGSLSDVLGVDIATIAGVVASAAIVVGTGGAGAPAVIALAATGLSVASEVGERLGLDPKVCALLAAGGAVAGVATGNLAAPAGVWGSVATTANVVRAGATAAGGAAHAVEGQYQADALDARAEAQAGKNTDRSAEQRFDSAIETLEKVARDLERARSTTSAIERIRSETAMSVIAAIGGA
jgi:hypothetical protein